MTAAYTALQVAEELGVSERTVRRWITSGDLAAEKQGGVFLIDLDAAREKFKRSRTGRSVEKSSELAELRGRYLEVCDRLECAESELAEERAARKRLERVLYMPAVETAEPHDGRDWLMRHRFSGDLWGRYSQCQHPVSHEIHQEVEVRV